MKSTATYVTVGAILIGVVLMGASSVGAQTTTAGYTTIIQRIAQKFNLQESDVKAVFDAVHDERQAQRKTELENRLTQAVTDKKITDAQKTAILNKFADMKMGTKKTEIETWAKDNGLTLELLQSLIGPGERGFGPKGHRPRPTTTPTPTP